MSDKRLTAGLFELSEGSYREVTLPAKFPFTQDVPALFDGNIVSQPMAIAKEGTYFKAGYDDAGKTVLRKIVITAADLSDMAANVRRDVPLNAEHEKYGPNYYGWVRAKTAPVAVQQGEDGLMSLFAHVEVTLEALGLIEKGRFRDFSPELDLVQKRLTGLALTNYPVMQEIHQFSEVVEEPASLGASGTAQAPAQPDAIFSEAPMTEAEKQTLMAELRASVEAEFSTLLDGLTTALEAEKTARVAAERSARVSKLTLEFSDKIAGLVKSKEGKAKLLPAGVDAATALYVFCSEHAGATVTLGDETLSPAQLLDKVFESVPATKLFSQTADDSSSIEQGEFSQDGFSDADFSALLSRTKSAILEQMSHA